MTVQRLSAAQAIARLESFGNIVDVRSPGEFAEDRLPGALNWPVLDDEERRLIGTEYKQVSPFEARKRGAALVAKNIAAHIARDVMDKPKTWQPLVYCWRGGQRSGSMSWFLDQMGFRTHVIEEACRLAGVSEPPLLSLEQAGLSPAALAFYAENRRVANGKAKRVLGWRPRYPTYREGLRALLENPP